MYARALSLSLSLLRTARADTHSIHYSDDEDEEGVSQKLHSRCPNFSVFPAGFVRTAGSRAIAGIFMLPWMS